MPGTKQHALTGHQLIHLGQEYINQGVALLDQESGGTSQAMSTQTQARTAPAQQRQRGPNKPKGELQGNQGQQAGQT
jgi:hypothetical protein